MRFSTITAHAFGALCDRTLELAPGMTVVFGPNEAGKSTWHAAIYAALCGIRRSRGAARARDREFAERHRPWDGEGWGVSARIELEDGRRIEIRQDLDGRVDCRATDLGLARDVSEEIIHEGSPDGSRWLGLDRDAFYATACVFQAELLSVRDSSAALQEYLQRAADTAGKDGTAAAALEAIDAFRREHVGVDRANARGPLRRAKESLERLAGELDAARKDHAAYLGLIEQAATKAAERDAMEQKRRGAARVVARQQEKALRGRLVRIRQLAEKFASGPPPPPSAGVEVAKRAAAAIEGWRNRPAVTELEGATAAEIERELAALPPIPRGDLAPHSRVTEAVASLRTAGALFTSHEREKPGASRPPEAGGATAQELRDLARELELPEPPVDPALARRVDAAKATVDRTRPTARRRVPVATALASLVAGGAAIAIGYGLAGVAIAVVGLLATLALVLWSDSTAHEKALAELREAESRRGVQEQLRMSVRARRENAGRSAESLGLAPDPLRLAELARQLEAAAQSASLLTRWQARREELLRDLVPSREDLQRALRERGCEVGSNLQQSFARYHEACEERARLAAKAGRAQDIRGRLVARQAAERAAAEARAAADRALVVVRNAAAECKIVGNGPEEILAALRAWVARHSVELKAREALALEYNQLEVALAGRDSASVIAELERKRSDLEAAGSRHPESASEEPADGATAAALLPALEGEVRSLDQQVNGLRGQTEERARRLRSVADAEEAFAEAGRELERVRRLERTLERTHEFLESAEERVHRDVAQLLAAAVRPWLPRITSGRYGDVSVDASDLTVKVKDPAGHWRDATLLSHGTKEQIYLLLRMALAEHLAKKGERCPLLLDEVTVQSDRERTARILDLLHALTSERQIVLFTQEEDVRDWAKARLVGERDRYIDLARAAARPAT